MFEYVFVIKRFSVNFPLGGLCVCVVMYCTVKWCDCVPVMIIVGMCSVLVRINVQL